MNEKLHTIRHRGLRVARTRKRLHAAAHEHPRLVVSRSNRSIFAQIIDRSGKVLAAASGLKSTAKTKTEQAAQVGEAVAKTAVAAGVGEVVFDRGAYRYHGRVKALAEAARKHGLKF